MTKQPLFGFKIPILYVNPAFNRDPRLIEEVSNSGGLGIVDHVTAGPADFQVPAGIPHGVRIPLSRLDQLSRYGQADLVLLPLEDADRLSALLPGALRESGVPVVVEVSAAGQAEDAEKAGAAGLVARGNEGPGWVGETSGLVLLQELVEAVDLPVFLQGGIGLRTAGGARAAGADGIVLDVHMLLASESGISRSLKDFLGTLSLPATVTLGECLDTRVRVYSRVGTKMVREMRKLEDSLTIDELPLHRQRLEEALRNPLEKPDSEEGLLPISDDVVIAKRLADEFKDARSIIDAFRERLSQPPGDWPFQEGSGLCRDHGTRYPVVQGPMAHVSDNADFLAAVADAGGLPFLAMGNMPAPIARESMDLAREKTHGRFGVGLIGLEVNREVYEAHLEIMAENPPHFAILAAGSVDLARRIEEMGTACYLHCPAPGVVREGLKAGHRHFVFEGCESGGHVGPLGSLTLWSANLDELETASREGLSLDEVTVLFAGGIAGARAGAFVAGMVHDLAAQGLKMGLQMGTAYLATSEAVSTGAITSTYQDLTVGNHRTVIIGRTVNTMARAAGSPMAAQLMAREQERLRQGVPLRERKDLYEKDNLGALRLAAKGCAIDPETAGSDSPVFCDLPPEEQKELGLYLMGQVVSVLDSPITMDALHERVLEQGRAIFEAGSVLNEESKTTIDATSDIESHLRNHGANDGSEPPLPLGEGRGEGRLRNLPDPQPAMEMECDDEPIAVVGIGLRLPGSESPDGYWDQIVNGRSGIGEVPEDRWGNVDHYYDPDPKVPDKTYSRIGGFIRDFTFDPLKYRIPPAVAKKMDRTQQMAVTCVADALEDAGLSGDALKGKKVGIILGNSMGGETTDQYAARLDLPRTLCALKESLDKLQLEPQDRKALLEDFRSRFLDDLPVITEDSLPGELANVISGRVANVFNLEGPNFTVDAACASSMAAVMNAVSLLRSRAVDFAITGGVDAAMHPSSFVKFCKIGALSPDGSRPFDEGANGFVMGEGAGIMMLKRLSDAVRDGDRVYGTIVGIGASSDGRGKGITAPNAAGQERALRNCTEPSGIDPLSVGLIEAHGTSTAVGDKTELIVLDRYFRDAGAAPGSVGIGSIKSQIGHLKAAAGAAGMIKAILSLYHRTLPRTINVREPNTSIDWETSPLFLLAEAGPWAPPNGRLRRAGVSAFGFGGTNFHIILQEHCPGLRLVSNGKKAPPVVEHIPPDWPRPEKMSVDGEAWILGAKDEAGLVAKIEDLLARTMPENWIQLASANRKDASSGAIRCGFASASADETVKKLNLIKEGMEDPRKKSFFPARGIHVAAADSDRTATGIAFLFPGQGSQYPFMLRDLADRYSVVSRTLEEADEVLNSLDLPGVTEAMFPRAGGGNESTVKQADVMKDTQLLQPMILAANTAIFRLLAAMGVQPVSVAGHSLGEYAACVAAGVFEFRDAIEAVAVRGHEMARVSIDDPGLMMSVPADARLVEEVLAEIDGYVVAANKNSPRQTVISGETAAVKKAGELFKDRGLDGIILPVSAAFHSGVVAPAREPFMKTLRKLTVKPPGIPVLSNVTGDFYPAGPAAPAQIRDLLGKQFAAPVEWVKSVRRLYGEGVRIFVECGPKRVMTNLTQDTLPDDILAMPTNHPKKGGILQLMETLAALAAEGVAIDFDAADGWAAPARADRSAAPELRVVRSTDEPGAAMLEPAAESPPVLLEGLVDPEIREIASKKEFKRFLEIQGEPIRGLIKSGFDTFVQNVLPLEQTADKVKSEGMDFRPPVVTGIAAGLPSDARFPFDKECLDDLILGRNFIRKVPENGRRRMLEKNVERLVKGPSGEAELEVVDDVSGVIKLAGFFSEEKIMEEYGVDKRLARSMDVTTRLALAAGIEAIKDAGIPLVQRTRTTSTGRELPDSWALPEPLRDETGVIFASAFPGISSLVDEVTREVASRYGSGARSRLIDFYTGLLEQIQDSAERDRITRWFTREFDDLNPSGTEELYTFNRDFLFRVMTMASGQLAQFIKARGPNTHVDAACASTTQAVLLARDWIRSGQAKRVVVVAADDVAGRTLLPWVGSGFLAMGAATTEGNVSEAALPFDDRRHGLILGSAAVGMVLENQDLARQRGVEPIASIEAGMAANSAFHGTRLDVNHISSLMQRVISRWEDQSGLSRDELARDVFFMSHETYSPKRGGSSAAEISALRETFGDAARQIPIANTKGFTGHTMGASVEDVVALRCLQKKTLPPIPNLKQPDPDFADLNLRHQGPINARYALRLAAGFGSQIVIALYKTLTREENRISDLSAHRDWLKRITGYRDPVVSVEDRTLKVSERAAEHAPAAEPTPQEHAAASDDLRSAQFQAAARGESEIREKILSLLSEKTGYPADMLDTDLDLEADLGIDTVKQAEFISEVREEFGIPRIEGLKIADFHTIEHIIGFVLQHSGQTSATESESNVDAAPGDTDIPADRGHIIREKILSLLSEKTGYPADMLDTDLDLEADLGIDTVKQAEFISEVREEFGIPRIEGLKIADFPTIEHIIGFVKEQSQHKAAEAAAETVDVSDEKTPASEEEIRLLETRLVALPQTDKIPLAQVDEALVFGGPDEVAAAVAHALLARGYSQVKRIARPELPPDAPNKRIGLINLFPLENGPEALRSTFELYLAAAAAFEDGPTFLVTAVSEDGVFGLENPSENAHLQGAAVGATKAFSREYPETRTRVLDLSPDLTHDEFAEYVGRSLEEDFPVEVGVGPDGSVKAIRLVPSISEPTESPGIRSGDVVLTSGGARGITSACLRHLAGQARLTFVILGRTLLSDRAERLVGFESRDWEQEKDRIVARMKREGTSPTPVKVDNELSGLRAEAEVFATMRDLRAAGSEVIYRPLDIRDREAVDQAIRETAEICGRVDTMIHAAGIDVSKALNRKTLDQMETVVSVKVDGMINLLDSLERHGLPPQRIIGFGSVAGRFGNLAQVDYSAANDGLSHLLRRADRDLGAKVSIIDWAPWSEIGMATRGSVQQSLDAAGIDFIPPEIGARIFGEELIRSSGACEVVAAGRLGPFEADAFHCPGSPDLSPISFAGQKGAALRLIPGEYVKASLTLDPSHPLLDHHRIDRAAVLPGVGGMEIMRAAATLLDPDLRDAEFQDVRFHSPLKIFKDDPFEAEVEVLRIAGHSDNSASYEARIISWFQDKHGRKVGAARLHHECVLSRRSSAADEPTKRIPFTQSVWISDHDLYKVFFHGPGFRFLDHVAVEGRDRGVRFRFSDTAQRDAMFTDSMPAAVEAAFQAAAAFTVESRGIMALPTGVQRAVISSDNSLPYEGELTFVRESSLEAVNGRKSLIFDGIMMDQQGDVILTLQGIELVELGPSHGFDGKVFEEILLVDEVAKEMEKDPQRFLNRILDEDEIRDYASKKTPKRAAEWITGRVGLKRSVQRLASTQSGARPSPKKNIRIIADTRGKPYAELSMRPGETIGDLSLSHSNGSAIAAATAAATFEGLGLDMERIEPRSEAWVQDYFTEEEIKSAGDGPQRWNVFTRIWSLKEAALKAMGTGLRFDLTDISVTRMNHAGRAQLEFRNEAARHLEETGPEELEARVEERDGMAIARVIMRRR